MVQRKKFKPNFDHHSRAKRPFYKFKLMFLSSYNRCLNKKDKYGPEMTIYPEIRHRICSVTSEQICNQSSSDTYMNSHLIQPIVDSIFPFNRQQADTTENGRKSIAKQMASVSTPSAKIVDSSRPVPLIDLSNFNRRREEISEKLWDAATNYGFFQLINHSIPTKEIDFAFIQASRFFDLPEKDKAKFPLRKTKNAGWESRKQVRSSTGIADQKESYQIIHSRMKGLWPRESQLPGFKRQMLAFEKARCFLSMQLMSCFAEKLGLERDFSPRPTIQNSQTTRAHCDCSTTTPVAKMKKKAVLPAPATLVGRCSYRLQLPYPAVPAQPSAGTGDLLPAGAGTPGLDSGDSR